VAGGFEEEKENEKENDGAGSWEVSTIPESHVGAMHRVDRAPTPARSNLRSFHGP
jgi:hypothetical protein